MALIPQIAVTHFMNVCSNMLSTYEEYIKYILRREEIYGLCAKHALLLMNAPPKPLPVNKWAANTCITFNNLTYMINKLRAQGFVERVIGDTTDNRVHFYQITPDGQRLVEKLKEANDCFLPAIYKAIFAKHSYKDALSLIQNISVEFEKMMFDAGIEDNG